MAKDKKTEPKVTLEREYIVPLRREWLKVAKYRRGKKAVKALKEFIAKHMKIYDRDLRKVKINIDLNNEIRFRGMKKPPAKIRVKARKFDDGIVKVELVDIPSDLSFKRLRDIKRKTEVEKKVKKKEEEKEEIKEKTEEKDEKKEEDKKEEIKEKEEAGKEESMKISEKQARESKHVSRDKNVKINRLALRK
jgi:large subunit ribosomal protein L31e